MNIIKKEKFHDVVGYKLGSNIFGRPFIFVYCYYIDDLLIDTGHPLIGKDISVALEDISINKIIVTHHHEDHSGNIERLKKAKGIVAYGSPQCCELMKHPVCIEPARLISWGQPRAANLQALDLNKKIETENYSFQILETPGHAIDQICLYEENEGWLLSADVFIHDYIKTFMRAEDIGAQIHSIKLILQHNFDTLLCSHQPILKNGKYRLQNKLDFLEEFYGIVAEEYHQGYNTDQILNRTNYKESYITKAFSLGQLSRKNMIRSVIRSEQQKAKLS